MTLRRLSNRYHSITRSTFCIHRETTGLPKPIVRGHGGITVEQLGLYGDLGPDDLVSTTGWMMWNHLIQASSDLDLGSHDDGALGGDGESVARVGGVVGEQQEEVLAPHCHAVAVS